VSNERDTGTYYDRLSRWTALARLLGYGGGRSRLTVHSAHADPRAGGRPTVTRLHDVLLEALPPLTHERVLDAGCGLGGTMLDFASRGGGIFTGITLSERQAKIGRKAVARANLGERVRIVVQSYDTPAAAAHDVVVAIESLAHSPDPYVSLRAMAGRLAPGGLLAVVDDMPTPAARGTRDLAAFQAGWRLPVLWTADELVAALTQCGLVPVVHRDLTDALRPRDVRGIARLEALNRLARRYAPTAGLRALLDSHHGGLALERLYRNSLMQYRLVVARKSQAAAARGVATNVES
jgi:SAM-dependent methyltransferase